jgi:chromosome segregation ATPase
MSTALKLVSEDDELEALRREAKALRDALRDKEKSYDFIEGVTQNLSRHIVALHEQFSERLTMLTLHHESRCQQIEKRLAEVGALADRLAQEQTVRNLRDPADNESTADAIEQSREFYR